MQLLAIVSIIQCEITLHVSGALCTHNQEYIKTVDAVTGTNHVSVWCKFRSVKRCSRTGVYFTMLWPWQWHSEVDSRPGHGHGIVKWTPVLEHILSDPNLHHIDTWFVPVIASTVLMYSWWWVPRAPETCRVISQSIIKTTAKGCIALFI